MSSIPVKPHTMALLIGMLSLWVQAATPVLQVDFNDRDSAPDTPNGFVSFEFSGEISPIHQAVTRTYGTTSVTLTPRSKGGVPLYMDDFKLASPAAGAFANAGLYNDGVFLYGSQPGDYGIIDLVIDDSTNTSLLPNAIYSLSLWVFDLGSNSRIGQWQDPNHSYNLLFNANAKSTINNVFVPPDDESDYRWTAQVYTNAAGAIHIIGSELSGVNPVVINALSIEPVPEPATLSFLVVSALLFNRRRRNRTPA